ncbi:MAG: hypothetical protein HPY74_07345 [Firmicutes bacterium]|nr:hypothetical protein [Bacillota bacterium]
MSTYKNISNELKVLFSSNSIFRILLPIDVVLVFGGVIFMILSALFPGLGLDRGFFGNLLSSVAFWAFLLGLLLAYANLHEETIYVGCFLYSLLQLIYFIKYIRFFLVGYLVPALIFAGIGYLVFKRNSAAASSQDSMNL